MQLLHALSLAATFVTVVIAQGTPSISDLPNCAKSCVGSNLGGCNQLSVQCICSNKDYINNLSCCVATSCSQADQDATIKFAVQICQAVGVSVPTQAGCSAGASSTATAGSSTASGAGGNTSSAAGSSGAAAATTATGSASTKVTASATAASSSATHSGAAVHNTGNTFGMGVAIAGLLAML